MKKLVVLFLLFATIAIANACTITPSTTTGTTGQSITFTLNTIVGEEFPPITRTCESGGASASVADSGQFLCTYNAPGTKTVTVTPSDFLGDSLPSCTATATISAPVATVNQAPIVTIISPTNNGRVTGGSSVTFTGTASDLDGTVSLVEVRITSAGSGGGCGNGAWQNAVGTTSWTFTWTPPVSRTGCAVEVRARDNSGLESSVTSASFSTSAANSPSTPSDGPAATICRPNEVSCENRQRTVCNAAGTVANPQRVDCCSSSDCEDTCVGSRYRRPSCVSNVCEYGTLQSIPGLCSAVAAPVGSCQVGVPSTTRVGVLTPVIVRYRSLASAAGSVVIECGNGGTSIINCAGTSGNCSGTCTFLAPGTFTPRVSIGAVQCSTLPLTVTGEASTSTTSRQTREEVTTITSAAPLFCRLSSTDAAVAEGVRVTIDYSGAVTSPGLVTVNCGDGRTATAPNCASSIFGNGQCSATCTYAEEGRYTQTSSIQGVACTPKTVNVEAGEQSGGSLFSFENREADVAIENFVTRPAVVVEDQPAELTALVKSDQPVVSAVCTPLDNQESSCNCELTQTTEANPLVECTVEPPVNGKYQITFTGEDGKTKTTEVTLIPGEAGTIEVINRPSDNYSLYLIVLVLGLIAAGTVYWFVQKLTAASTYKNNLFKKRQDILKEINYAKASFMKGQLGQPQFQKIYNDKQKELTETNAKIAEVEKENKKQSGLKS